MYDTTSHSPALLAFAWRYTSSVRPYDEKSGHCLEVSARHSISATWREQSDLLLLKLLHFGALSST